MRPLLTTLSATLLAVGLGPALAQVPPPPPTPPLVAPPPAPLDYDLGPNDEVVVREYIVRRPPPPVRFEPDYKLRPGSVVPNYVELAPMVDTPDPRLRRYAFFVSPDDKLVVVDPATRVVVRILDR